MKQALDIKLFNSHHHINSDILQVATDKKMPKLQNNRYSAEQGSNVFEFVCLSVCVLDYSRVDLGPSTKRPKLLDFDCNLMTPSPTLPQFCHPIMHFQIYGISLPVFTRATLC